MGAHLSGRGWRVRRPGGRGIASAVAALAVHRALEHHPDRPVLACTTEDDVASQRTALAAGLVRRPDLEHELDGLWAVVFTSPG